tara:strand:- start:10879 stop:11517 length:639 start_codon:yes stop_codon:yes gene_type:complete
MLNARFLAAAVVSAGLAAGCSSEKISEPAASPAPATTEEATASAAKTAKNELDEKSANAPVASDAARSSEPTPAQIDALQMIVAADGFKDMAPQNDLWVALFQLKQWHLMTFPDSTSVPPGLNIETHDGKKWVMAFTDPDRLYKYAKARKLLNADGTMFGMSVPSQTSFEFFESMPGVAGVRFNEGDVGWFAPMPNLRAIHTHLVKLGRLKP